MGRRFHDLAADRDPVLAGAHNQQTPGGPLPGVGGRRRHSSPCLADLPPPENPQSCATEKNEQCDHEDRRRRKGEEAEPARQEQHEKHHAARRADGHRLAQAGVAPDAAVTAQQHVASQEGERYRPPQSPRPAPSVRRALLERDGDADGREAASDIEQRLHDLPHREAPQLTRCHVSGTLGKAAPRELMAKGAAAL